MMVQMTCLQFKRKGLLLELSFVYQILYLLYIFRKYGYIIFDWSNCIVWNHLPRINVTFIGQSVSTYEVLSLEQATKAQRGSRGIALFFL